MAYIVPVSVKGIVFEDGSVWLRKNERGEWELPGGKMDEGEQPEDTVVREMEEELGFEVKVIDLVQAYLYTIHSSKDESHGVLVLSYLCEKAKVVGEFETRGEAGHAEFRKFPVGKVSGLHTPNFYKHAISKAWRKFSS